MSTGSAKLEEKRLRTAVILILWLTLAPTVSAESLHIATAANFKSALQQLLAEFPLAREHSVQFSSASTGTLYAQIVHGSRPGI